MYAKCYNEGRAYLSLQIDETPVDKSKYKEYHVPLCFLEDTEIKFG